MLDAREAARDPRLADTTTDPFDFDAHVASAELDANAAQLTESLSQIIGGQHQVMAGFRRFETLIAEKARTDSQQTAALAKLIVTPDDLCQASYEGASQGVENSLHQAVQRITVATQRVGQVETRLVADAQARHSERSQWVRATSAAALGSVIAMLIAAVTGAYVGERSGRAKGYASARDEIAAATWANTAPGRFARHLDQGGMLGRMMECEGEGFTRARHNNRAACFTTLGWYLQ